MSNADIRQLDLLDPLANMQDHFRKPDGVIYLDGNSLGLMPRRVAKRIQTVTEKQWGESLIASWNTHGWIDLPQRVGNKIGSLIGAAAGQVVCCDSISVNLFKVLANALLMQNGRHKVLSTKDNFPTDLYMVEGLSSLLGEHKCVLKTVEEDSLISSIDDSTAVVMVTEVNFRTGNILNIQELSHKAHEMGALIIVDLAHSAGVMPVELDQWQVDFAVGCTYKYLNGGPGAPAFVYAAERYHDLLNQPLYGWMGHSNGFDFSPYYSPSKNVSQMLVGTPPIISMSAVDAALDVYEGVDIEQIRQKSMQLTSLFKKLIEQSSQCGELKCISPVNAEQRGSQLSFEFEHAYALCQALIGQGVIADFRAPNYIRFGFAPLYITFSEVEQAVSAIIQIMTDQEYLKDDYQIRNTVT